MGKSVFGKKTYCNKVQILLTGELLASLWSLLGQYPTMLVRKASTENAELARALQLSLEKLSSQFPMVTSSAATLLLIDRGADLKTPLMHDIAFQVSSLYICQVNGPKQLVH